MWLEADQDKAIAWKLEQAERCGGCSQPLYETTDDDLRHEWELVPGWCNACERLNTAARSEQADKSDTSGRFWSVRKKNPGG